MRRSLTLALLLPLALALSRPSPAQDADRFAKVEIKVTKVAGTVYMLEGAGGNIAVSVGEDGVVIVDDQYAPLVDKIRAALRGVTDKPVRFVLNTHYHGDHTGGNALLQKEAPVIAHDNVRKRLAAGGSVKGLIAGVESVVAQLPADVKVIPGHGKVSTLDDVRRFVAMVNDSRAAVEKALAAGRTVEQMKAAGVLDPWKSYSGDFVSTDRWLETLVNELTGRRAGEFVRH